MGARAEKPDIMIATLGVEPQVVTIALDKLLDEGYPISQVVVVFTAHPEVLAAARVLEREFSESCYSEIAFSGRPINWRDQPVIDFTDEESVYACLQTLYDTVNTCRQRKQRLHLNLSGGRKMMAVMGMVAGQLLFGPEDRMWYLFTEGWRPGHNRELHLEHPEQACLIQVPVLVWREASRIMHTVAYLGNPEEVLRWFNRLNQETTKDRQREFLRYWLTPSERAIVALVCQGLDNEEIAVSLSKQKQTVANQLCRVYEKLREWLGFPDRTIERSALIAEFVRAFDGEPQD